ncbi:ribosome hibernation factor-recruiting GTPase MRF [Williamsia sp. CHRR-6]|uniref:ribosome hibernation factor-recruiting GTPase MRF n=1 Tax=Williamsia sp. CHRR-6 TaxID=2835871 RepID=UPI0035B3B218
MSRTRTPLVVIAGLDPVVVDSVAAAHCTPGTVVVHHDLVELSLGAITRTLRMVDADGQVVTRVERMELDHACVSCTLREDLLPLLRALHRRSSVRRIVIALDGLIEPEPLCWAIDSVMVTDVPGQIDGPASLDVEIEAVIGCVDAGTWVEQATGDETLAEAGLAGASGADFADERTLSQVVVGHVDFSDVLVVHGGGGRENWDAAVFGAVIARLAPGVPVLDVDTAHPVSSSRLDAALSQIPTHARRGRVYGAHDPLLPGQPPLEPDCGVQIVEFHADRPLHPGRLHDAIDCLLDGVVCARGRLWLATQPEEALWLESAGGGLRVATGGAWLAAMTPAQIDECDPERVSMAAARWHPEFGDRETSIVVLVHRADPVTVQETLRSACVTDAELADGLDVWLTYDDPFGAFHSDPCDDGADEGADPTATVSTDAGEHRPGQEL